MNLADLPLRTQAYVVSRAMTAAGCRRHPDGTWPSAQEGLAWAAKNPTQVSDQIKLMLENMR